MKYFLTYLLLFSTILATAQVQLKNMELTAPDSAVLLLNEPNKISVTAHCLSPIQLSASDGTAVKRMGRNFQITPYKAGPVLLTLSAGKERLNFQYNAVEIPAPTVRFEGTTNAELSVTEILNSPGLRVIFPNCLWNRKFFIYSFVLSIESLGKVLYRNTHKDRALNAEQREVIQQLKPGDVLNFSDIYLLIPCPKRVSSFTIRIK